MNDSHSIRKHLAPNSLPRLSVSQFLVFAGVGGIGTLAHYVVLIAGVQLLAASAVTASVAGYTVGAVTNFVLSARLAFRTNASLVETAPRFFTVATAGFLLNWVMMRALVESLGIQYLAAQIAVTACILVFNYVANAIWTFGGARRGR